METFTNEIMGSLLASSIGPATYANGSWRNASDAPGAVDGKYMDWLTISDPLQSIRDDVQRIRNHPLVPLTLRVHGYQYDVRTGLLSEVT